MKIIESSGESSRGGEEEFTFFNETLVSRCAETASMLTISLSVAYEQINKHADPAKRTRMIRSFLRVQNISQIKRETRETFAYLIKELRDLSKRDTFSSFLISHII